MGVTRRLRSAAGQRPHALVAAMPGGTASRLAVEAHLRRRNWPSAWSPADADVLVVCGAVVTGLRTAVEELWAEIPGHRARTCIVAPVLAPGALDAARARLATPSGERTGAPGGIADQRANHPGMSHGDMDDDMSMPAGLAMAERGDDRDGLELDQLHVTLGPLLVAWPAGFVVRVTLQGDVVQSARPELVGGQGLGSFWVEPATRAMYGEAVTVGEAARRTAGCYLDRLGRFLAVAGWPDPAAAAGVLRDDILAGAARPEVLGRFEALVRRVGRSRTLEWMTAGLGVLGAADATALGVTGPVARAGGDVTARYRQWLTDAAEMLDLLDDPVLLTARRDHRKLGNLHDAVTPPEPLLAAIERLVIGTEIGAARLIVASFDPDVDEMAGRPAAVANG